MKTSEIKISHSFQWQFYLLIFLTSCDFVNTEERRTDQVEDFKIYFEDNRHIFESIVDRIMQDENIIHRTGEKLHLKSLDELSLKQLTRLKIEYFSIKKTDCDRIEIEFITTWTTYPVGQTYLTMTCPYAQTNKDTYNKFGLIEIWGLGGGWLLWIDSDFI